MKKISEFKITKIEIFIILIVIFGLIFYFFAKNHLNNDVKKHSVMRANAAIFTAKSLQKFAKDKSVLPTSVSSEVIGELRGTIRNPYNKKENAYSLNDDCNAGCLLVIPSDKNGTITVTGYTNDDKVVVRTIIKPPSFVEYSK